MQSLKTEEWAGVLKTRGQPARFFETLGSFSAPVFAWPVSLASLRRTLHSKRQRPQYCCCAESDSDRLVSLDLLKHRCAGAPTFDGRVLSHVQPVKQTHGRYAASAAALSMPPLAMTGRAAITPAR